MLLVFLINAGNPGTVNANLPEPKWMPGSPILAGDQVILLWTPIPGAVKYRIYMNDKKVQESVSIQAIVPAPQEAGVYEFLIAAIDASGAEGAKSIPGKISIFKLTEPRDLNGRVVAGKVSIHWSPVAGAVMYNVYRSTETGKGYALAESTQDVRWTDSNAKENSIYYYRVTAKEASGKESSPSKELSMSTKVQEVVEQGAKTVVMGKKTRVVGKISNNEYTSSGIVKISAPTDVEPSPDGKRFYVASALSSSVMIMDRDGNFIGQFGEAGDDPGMFRKPIGIGVSSKGEVFVADAARNDIQVFDAEGKFIRVFARLERKDWMKKAPRANDVAVEKNGTVHVLEYNNAAVITYNANGEEKGYFFKFIKYVEKGTMENSTYYPTSLRIVGDELFMADGAFSRVVVMDRSGKFLRTYGEQGTGIGKLAAMSGFAVGSDGRIYLIDGQTGVVQVYDLKDRKYRYTLANEENTTRLSVLGPMAIWVDGEAQRAYITEGMANQVQVVEMFGEPEEPKGSK